MITFVWLINRELCWHTDYIDFIFKNVPHQHVNDYGQNECYDNCYVVVGTQHGITIDPTAYLKRMRDNGKRFAILHLCDEWFQENRNYYEYSDIILRNYYIDLGPKVHTFTVGWNKGYPHTLEPKSISQRQYTWSFGGHIDKTTRGEMVQYMNTVPNGKSFFKICGEPGQYNGYVLSTTMMAELINDSVFVPCPQGNHSMETCRLCETLQMGALPIVERNEIWKIIYGDDHPLIQIDSWSEAPKLIEDLMRDPIALENKRQATYKWWIDHLAKIQQKVMDLL